MTKKQLGIIFILLGVIVIAGMFLMDAVGAGQFQGVGPAQRLAMLAAGGVILVGVSLLPLGDKPA